MDGHGMYLFNVNFEEMGCHNIIELLGFLVVSSICKKPGVVVLDSLKSPLGNTPAFPPRYPQ